MDVIKEQQARVDRCLRAIGEMALPVTLEDYYPGCDSIERVAPDQRERVCMALYREQIAIAMLGDGAKCSMTLADKLDYYSRAVAELRALPPEDLDKIVSWAKFRQLIAQKINDYAQGGSNE